MWAFMPELASISAMENDFFLTSSKCVKAIITPNQVILII
ncbi:MAG: hypothetical protein RLZZ262_1806 [Bacteroidota bacterium]